MWYFILVLFLRLQVYPLHSSVTLEEQNNVFLSPVPGYRKVGGWEDEAWDIIVLSGELWCLGPFPVCSRLLMRTCTLSCCVLFCKSVLWKTRILLFVLRWYCCVVEAGLEFEITLYHPLKFWGYKVYTGKQYNVYLFIYLFFWMQGWGFAVLGVGSLSEAVVWILRRLLAVLFVFNHYSLQLLEMIRVWDLSFDILEDVWILKQSRPWM